MKKSVNIVLIIVLVGLVGTLGFFSYKLFFKEDKVVVPDFTNATKADVETWCNSFETNPCKFETDYSDSVPEGQVIYQSISAEEELGESIAFIISQGKKIEVVTPQVTKETKKVDIINWAKENNIPNPIEYVEENSDDIENDYVIKLEPAILTDETTSIRVYVSIGPKEDKKDDEDKDNIEVTYGDYINISEDDFKSKVAKINLTPNHKESKDAYSNTIPEGNIVWHGSGSYTKNETINYGLSLGKKDGTDEEITWPMVIKRTDFAGKSLDDFTKLMKKYGLKPVHRSEWDDYSDTIEKGYILRNGEGTYYEDDETISYALSLGKKGESTPTSGIVNIKEGQYVGKSLSEFKKICSDLGLTIEHSSTADKNSSTVAKDCVLWHGSGEWNIADPNDRVIHYYLSLGPNGSDPVTPDTPTVKQVTVDGSKYMNFSVDDFKSKMSQLGLSTNHNANNDAYGDYPEGNICWYNSGTFDEGSTISYGVSKGPRMVAVLPFNDICDFYEKDTYDSTASVLRNYFSSTCQLSSDNIHISGEASTKGVGKIISININGNPLNNGGNYPITSTVDIIICNEQTN